MVNNHFLLKISEYQRPSLGIKENYKGSSILPNAQKQSGFTEFPTGWINGLFGKCISICYLWHII